jgi:hypothetical protein
VTHAGHAIQAREVVGTVAAAAVDARYQRSVSATEKIGSLTPW